jgi:hypothetical protein
MLDTANFDVLFLIPFAAALTFMSWVFWSLCRELKHHDKR